MCQPAENEKYVKPMNQQKNLLSNRKPHRFNKSRATENAAPNIHGRQLLGRLEKRSHTDPVDSRRDKL